MVMVIIAILTAIAVPAYQSHVTKTNRSAAKSCLSEYAQYMERFYTTKLTYVGAGPGPGMQVRQQPEAALHVRDVESHAKDLQPHGHANRGAGRADTQCAVLSMNQDGTPNATGSGGKAFCW